MKRRRIIKLSAYVTGGALIHSVLPGCKSDTLEIDIDNYKPSFLNSDQYAFIKNLSETLLPETDTVGANSVGLAEIYDSILNSIYSVEEKTKSSEKLSLLMNTFQEENKGKDLNSLSSEEKLIFVKTIDKKFFNSESESAQTYKEIKSRLIHYYLKTEEVGTTLLNYLPVPGEYQACISLQEAGGKAWAL